MRESVNNIEPRIVATACPRASCIHRQRGSVLVLVMTLLGVLFVTGVAFLATMNFESQLISSQQLRDRNRIGAGTVVDEVSAILHDGFMAGPGLAFGHGLVGESLAGFADLPGVHNVSATMEPREIISGGGVVRYVFDAITDVSAINNGDHMGQRFRALFDYQDFAKGLAFAGVDTLWQPGVPVVLEGNPAALTIDMDGDGINDAIMPVDADGDGISDTLAYPLSDLGFTDTQIAAVSAQLNSPTNRTGEAYLGLRVIAHGGMVNLNESHPQLIANVFEIGTDDLTDPPNIELGYFLHRPSSMCDLDSCPKYSSAVEEPLLRRRGLLPPRRIPPSLLHGTPQPAGPTSAPGNADMGSMLYPLNRDEPLGYETVFDHTYTPFSPTDWDAVADAPVWATRMEPFAAGGDKYDRRHLVTTISHDDLLSRGAVWQPSPAASPIDMLKLMRQANRAASIPGTCPAVLPFEYADYPQDIPNETIPNFEGSECTCPTDDVCRFDARKGRLQLSLAWLDEWLVNWDVRNCEPLTGTVRSECKLNGRAVRRRMIYDVYVMLVSNARGPAWDFPCFDNGDCVSGTEVCDTTRPEPVCVDMGTGRRTRRLDLISRTAASLTANMIDYMDLECQGGPVEIDGMECRVEADCDGGACLDRGIPTRIALRSFDFDERRCVDSSVGTFCDTDADCSGGTCVPTAGWEFGSERLPPPFHQTQFVYGLERQPYITEIVTFAAPKNKTIGTVAIELFNPYDVDITTVNEYSLVFFDENNVRRPTIPLVQLLVAEEFTVLIAGPRADVGLTGATAPNGKVFDLPAIQVLRNDWTVYLVRNVAFTTGTEEIVVDQFKVEGQCIGRETGDLDANGCDTPPFKYSLERVAPNATAWTWTVPVAFQQGDPVAPTLGDWNFSPGASIRPVEVNFANTGSFTKLHPINDSTSATYNAAAAPLGVAFPTTGAMLLLMRHANRPLDDHTQTTELAFTSWLNRTTKVPNPEDPVATLDVLERQRVDNGRMSVFDPPATFCFQPGLITNRCNINADCPTGICALRNTGAYVCSDTGDPCDPNRDCAGLECQEIDAAHHVMPSVATLNQPGDLESLPWGQLVFDYFTVLPLSNPGPYVGADFSGDLDVQPRVDLDGLRVHGRININAAPWKVLAGLPLVPATKLPAAYAKKIGEHALSACVGGTDDGQWCNAPAQCNSEICGPLCNGGTNANLRCATDLDCPGGTCPQPARTVADGLAQAIVAYRELRDGLSPDPTNQITGNYGIDGTGRGWSADNPAYRRGSGFMSVGELANIRHAQAAHAVYRTDAERATAADADFVEAIARLVALGDWVTVRSHVHTVYGTLRGEIDESIVHANAAEQAKLRAADVDKRAVRFQETVDRLPTFLGRQQPVRIGERVVRKYLDVRTD